MRLRMRGFVMVWVVGRWEKVNNWRFFEKFLCFFAKNGKLVP